MTDIFLKSTDLHMVIMKDSDSLIHLFNTHLLSTHHWAPGHQGGCRELTMHCSIQVTLQVVRSWEGCRSGP